MKKALVVYNPVAGLHNIVDIEKIIKNALKKHSYTYIWYETKPQKKQPLDQFASLKFDRVIAVGGDGTILEVANFLLRHNLKTPLGIVANGSANVLAMSLGIPVFTVRLAISFALTKNAKPLDAMYINKKHFGLIVAGQGYESVFINGASRALKRKIGFFAYFVSFFKTFFTYSKKQYNIVVDGVRHRTVGKAALVFNVMAFTGIPLDKNVKPNDGLLNLIIINPRTFWHMIGISFLFLFRLSDRLAPKIQKFSGKQISVNRKHVKEIQVDGEVFKEKNLQIEVKPGALQVVYTKTF